MRDLAFPYSPTTRLIGIEHPFVVIGGGGGIDIDPCTRESIKRVLSSNLTIKSLTGPKPNITLAVILHSSNGQIIDAVVLFIINKWCTEISEISRVGGPELARGGIGISPSPVQEELRLFVVPDCLWCKDVQGPWSCEIDDLGRRPFCEGVVEASEEDCAAVVGKVSFVEVAPVCDS